MSDKEVEELLQALGDSVALAVEPHVFAMVSSKKGRRLAAYVDGKFLVSMESDDAVTTTLNLIVWFKSLFATRA
jgi:hypothetical protein